LKRSRVITTTTAFMLHSKAIRLHKLVVNPNANKSTWSITDGRRIAAGSSNVQWRLGREFEAHTSN